MAYIYSGVPIGGTILWLGSLAGLPIPSNYVANYSLGLYTNPRRDADFTVSVLPSRVGYHLAGFGNTALKFQEDENLHSVSLVRSHLPRKTISKKGKDFPTFSISGSQMATLWEVNSTTYTNTTTSKPCSSTGNLYTSGYRAPYTSNGWSQDAGPTDFGGDSYFYVWGSGRATGNFENGEHYHGNSVSYSHSHKTSEVTGLVARTSWHDRSPIYFNDTGSQEALTYSVNTPAIGALLITRVF